MIGRVGNTRPIGYNARSKELPETLVRRAARTTHSNRYLMKPLAAGIALGMLLLAAGVASGADEQPPGIALPPIETAGSDERGRIMVNGKPFFPIVMLLGRRAPGRFLEQGAAEGTL